MEKNNHISLLHKVSGLVMILALLWLCICTPFVYAAEQLTSIETIQDTLADDTDEMPVSNTTEEKSSSGTSTLSEYLHELLHEARPFAIIAKFYKCHLANIYFAYHPELLSPPPEA